MLDSSNDLKGFSFKKKKKDSSNDLKGFSFKKKKNQNQP